MWSVVSLQSSIAATAMAWKYDRWKWGQVKQSCKMENKAGQLKVKQSSKMEVWAEKTWADLHLLTDSLQAFFLLRAPLLYLLKSQFWNIGHWKLLWWDQPDIKLNKQTMLSMKSHALKNSKIFTRMETMFVALIFSAQRQVALRFRSGCKHSSKSVKNISFLGLVS